MHKLLLAALLGSIGPAYGQREAPRPGPEKPFIEVTGTASREVAPDRIFLATVLQSRATDKPGRPVPQQEAELRRVLAEQGLAPTLLTLTDASAATLAGRRRDAGPALRKEFQLQLATAGQVAARVPALQAAGIREVAVGRTEYPQLESLQKEVRTAALRAARDKATYLLQALGEQPDRPLEIREVTTNDTFAPALLANVIVPSQPAPAAPDEDAPLRFANVEVRFSYFVRYGIK